MGLYLEVKITSGLGNQLFQYATGRCLAVKNKIPHLLLNVESYKNDGAARQFGLKHFSTEGSVIENALINNILKEGTTLNRLVSALPLYGRIRESGLKLHTFPPRLRLLTSLNGYWQSEFYFKEIRELLIEELVPLEVPAFPAWHSAAHTVAIHIRRTDYLSVKGFGSLSDKYYDNAIRLMNRRVKDSVFIVFSDDIAWCREKFRNGNFLFCDEPAWEKDYLQLFLMSRCRHQIIANSSFSWWAAWLNPNEAKIVIRPEKPFLDPSLMYESYYPAQWIGVEN